MVLATVYGDVHDIGKSLVNTILSNNGYTVYDLGKQVPVNTIIEKAEEVERRRHRPVGPARVDLQADAAVRAGARQARPAAYPVLIGGAAINRRFGRRAMFVEGDRAYASGVFYCKDAFEGLETMDALQDPDRRAATIAKLLDDARNDSFLHGSAGKDVRAGTDDADAERRARRSSGARRALLGNAHRCATSRWTRCSSCSISTSCTASNGARAARAPSSTAWCARSSSPRWNG